MNWFALPIIACSLACLNNPNPSVDETIKLSDHQIRVADIIDVSDFSLHARDQIGGKIVLTLPRDLAHAEFSRQELAVLARKRVPALGSLNVEKSEQSLKFEIDETRSTRSATSRNCSQLKTQRLKGQVISGKDLESTKCRAKHIRPAVRFDDVYGVVRASADLAPSTYLGRMSVPAIKHADKGDELVLRVVIGPVTIEKPVWALQPSNEAEDIFVVDSDGNVLRVPVLQRQES